MAKLHSKKKGKAGSKKPLMHVAPSWLEYSPEEVEEIIVKLAKQGHSATDIGRILRDQYGIGQVRLVCKKKISQILAENNIKIDYPDDLLALIKKAVRMLKHIQKNKSDKSNIIKLSHVESKIKRLVKYYIKIGKLPYNWKYSRDRAVLIVK
ncbi:MAG: 30S ribosomal protein S15 [Candidatus Micrarchaeota archaeon]|nr:30S ribosomal protein S15 [Candidatus Micrarchaeota archaeon]